LPGGLTFNKNEAFVMKIPVPILGIAFDKITKTFGLALAQGGVAFVKSSKDKDG